MLPGNVWEKLFGPVTVKVSSVTVVPQSWVAMLTVEDPPPEERVEGFTLTLVFSHAVQVLWPATVMVPVGVPLIWDEEAVTV